MRERDAAAHEPLTVLRGDDRPVDPRPEFTRRLRSRLRAGADLGEEVMMSVSAIAAGNDSTASESVVERPGALPYLTVSDARAAIDWYRDHLAARLRGEPILMDDGRIGHAELEMGGGAIYLADAFDDAGLTGPTPDRVSVSLMLAVPDTDVAVRSARDGGALVQREPYEGYGSRMGAIIDPFGHRWMLSGPSRSGVTPAQDDWPTVRHGDVGYVSLWVPDAERAAAFYGAVLGWEYDPSTRQVTNLSHRLGISAAPDRATLFLAYAVGDLEATRSAVRAAGGTVPENSADRHDAVDMVDSTGVEFAVFVPEPGASRAAENPSGHGDLTYLTLYTPDSGAVREFYGAVLGWTFTPGRIGDGWGVVDSRPMTGIAGGASRYEAVAMWAVDDVSAAVERVIAAGGTILSQPERQPYGISAECRDDQGARFYLGQY